MQRILWHTIVAAVCISLPFADSLQGQVPRRLGTITCVTAIDEIPQHPLGLTNQIGTINLVCTNDGRRPPGGQLESATHVTTDLMVSLNGNITNRIDFGEGADVTDVVLAFGGDRDLAGGEAGLGSSVDSRFPHPQYGRLAMSNSQLPKPPSGWASHRACRGAAEIRFYFSTMFPFRFRSRRTATTPAA